MTDNVNHPKHYTDRNIGHCRTILLRLVETTSGYESATWYGLLKNEWNIVLSALDTMMEGDEG